MGVQISIFFLISIFFFVENEIMITIGQSSCLAKGSASIPESDPDYIRVGMGHQSFPPSSIAKLTQVSYICNSATGFIRFALYNNSNPDIQVVDVERKPVYEGVEIIPTCDASFQTVNILDGAYLYPNQLYFSAVWNNGTITFATDTSATVGIIGMYAKDYSPIDRFSSGTFGIPLSPGVQQYCIYFSAILINDRECNGVHNNASGVCSGHGTCGFDSKCTCEPEYTHENCQHHFCWGVPSNSSKVCNSSGECPSTDVCVCNSDSKWKGPRCEVVVGNGGPSYIEWIIGGIVGAVVLVCVFVVLLVGVIIAAVVIVVVLVVTRRKRKSNLLTELEEEESIKMFAEMKIDKSLFTIKIEEIEVIKSIGKGAFAVVYLAKWADKEVAYKVFNTSYLASSTNDFSLFEKELKLFSSMFHPNIVSFYGAILVPPRCGIVMEYCGLGDLKGYVSSNKVSLIEKIRIFSEISSAMKFIHSKNVLHRDLKGENILVADKIIPKLVDFGVSKHVTDMQQEQTTSVGTSIYMAPEIVNSSKYDLKVDVYSFAIMMFCILSGNFKPYGDSTFRVEMKVAQSEEFRPNIDSLPYSIIEKKWIVDLMKKNWKHDPEERDSFEEMFKVLKKNYEVMKDEIESVGK